jgi:NAD(P)H dehydrogenase (quinone)
VIAVLGASGQIGGLVAAELAVRGAAACALVRRPVDALPLPARRADLADASSLNDALRGVERLFLVTPHGPDQDLLEHAAITAAARAGVQRIVKISGSAASLGPDGPTTTAVSHWRSERLIEQSGLGFTFLRPSFFAQNLLARFAPQARAAGVLASPLGSGPIAMVDVRDVAACAVQALIDPDPADMAWQLTGPSAVTMAELAKHLGVRHVSVPVALASRALRRAGASEFDVGHAARMARYFASGADGIPTDHVRQLTSRAPRPATAVLDEHAADFVPATPLARILTGSLGG